MRVGYFAIGIGASTKPEGVRTIACHAERLGFASLWAPEHVVLVDRYASKSPYAAGQFPVPTDGPIGDPFARPLARRPSGSLPASASSRSTNPLVDHP